MKVPLRVLHVEDEVSDSDLVLHELRRSGREIEYLRVESEEQFRTALDDSEWDLVLCDYALPHFDGLAAFSIYQQSGLDIPFIIVSGQIGEETAVTAMKAGVHDYVWKSNLRRLLPAIERELHQAQVRRERRVTEEAMQKSEEQFRALIVNALDVTAIVEPDGVIRFISPSVKDLLGYTPDEMMGKVMTEFIHPEDAGPLEQALGRTVRTPGHTEYEEFRVRHKDGSWRTHEGIAKNLIDNPAVGGIIINSRDITERQQLESQLRGAQRMEAIGKLAGGIAHDFNNILAIIVSYSGFLLDRIPEGDPARKDIDVIDDAANRGASLTRQLLAFSRQQPLKMELIEDLNKIFLDMEKMLRRLIGEDIELLTTLSKDLGQIKADVSQIEQIIMNLAVNARDAMPTGGKLTIETENVDLDEAYATMHASVQPGSYVSIVVTDSGTGMDEETRSKVFEPFFTTKEIGKGTGLGLSTVYGIVKQMGGSIWVYSEPGQGTSFKIHLPRIREGAVQAKPLIEGEVASGGSETILVVEDEEHVRIATRRILEKHGFTILEAENGAEAIHLCDRFSGEIHLILTDVIMPKISGRELTTRLESIRPDMRVLYMSGYTENAVQHHGILGENIILLDKPFTEQSLLKKVQEALGTSSG